MCLRANFPIGMNSDTSVYEAVAAPRRRAICRYLAATDNTEVTLAETTSHLVSGAVAESAGSVAASDCFHRIGVHLHHTHLPKLADAAVLQYDHERKVVRIGPELPVVINLIRARHAMALGR